MGLRGNHPLDYRGARKDYFYRKHLSSMLNSFVKSKDAPLKLKHQESQKLSILIRELRRMQALDDEGKRRRMAIHGLSIPELIALVKIYDVRHRNATAVDGKDIGRASLEYAAEQAAVTVYFDTHDLSKENSRLVKKRHS